MSFSVGAFTKLAINGKRFDFKHIDPADSAHHLVDGSDGRITGSRIPHQQNVVPGMEVHKNNILLEPTVEELAELLPFMGIPNTSGTTYTIAETISSFTMIIDRVNKVHTYSNTFIDKWILRGQKGLKPVSLELQTFSLTDSEGNAGSFSATEFSTATGPYAFSMGTMVLNGNTHQFNQFVLASDSRMIPRYNNSETADDAMPTDSQIVLATSLPYSTANEAALFTTGASSTRHTGFAGSLTFTFGTVSTAWSFANLKTPNQPPPIKSKFEEVRLPRWFTAYKTAATAQLVVTHDSTV